MRVETDVSLYGLFLTLSIKRRFGRYACLETLVKRSHVTWVFRSSVSKQLCSGISTPCRNFSQFRVNHPYLLPVFDYVCGRPLIKNCVWIFNLCVPVQFHDTYTRKCSGLQLVVVYCLIMSFFHPSVAVSV